MFTSLYINTSLYFITYDTYENVTLFYYFDWINKATKYLTSRQWISLLD